MTTDDAIKILSILKAAYPSSYKGMTREEATGTISVWATQFSQIPAEVVYIAVNKLISTSQFPPAISQVREKLYEMYYEAATMLAEHKQTEQGYYGRKLDAKTKRVVEMIYDATAKIRAQEHNEPSIFELTKSGSRLFLTDNAESGA